MSLTQTIIACLTLASTTYNVPVDVLTAIHKVEGGYNGAAIQNTNGTLDMGAMQINTLWLSVLSEKWNLPEKDIENVLINDSCASASVAGWILSQNLKESNGDIAQAVGHYHSRTPKFRDRYIRKVFTELQKIYEEKSHGQ